MRHTREEVIKRTIREFELLDQLVSNLSDADWGRFLPRPETKEPWTVKDALAHITHWKADTARRARGLRRPPEERGLGETEANHLIYIHWRLRSSQEVLAWHRQVQQDVLAALREAPEEWFGGKEHREEWPYDLTGHSFFHRVKDIEQALERNPPLPWSLALLKEGLKKGCNFGKVMLPNKTVTERSIPWEIIAQNWRKKNL